MIDNVTQYIDYGFSVGIVLFIMVLMLKYLFPRVEKDFTALKEATEANTRQISVLTTAIEGQTQTVERILAMCEKAFNDNRQTIKLLMEHITRREIDKKGGK